MNAWREVALGELIEISHGYAFKGEYFSEGGEKRVVTPGNFFEAGGFRDRGAKQKSYDGPIPAQYILNPGEIVVAMTEQAHGLLGSSGLVPDTGTWLHNQRIGRVRFRDRSTSRRFVYYLFNTPAIRAQISATATGAKVRHTAPERILAVKAVVPDPPMQARIATVLSAFDELIEINERRIDLLERLVRALYVDWFVRFRYPGHDGANGIPPGWQRRPASQVLIVNPRVRSSQTSFPKVTMGDVDERLAVVFPSEQVTRASGSRFQRDDVLFARITPCLENGKTALVKFLERDSMGVGSTEFIVLRGNVVGPAFTYCAARSDPVREHAIKSMSGASGRQRVASNAFDSVEIVEPSKAAADEFERQAGPLLDGSFVLASQNRALARVRDLLLPRLVTGRLDLSDVDLGDLLPDEDAE